MTPAFQKQLHVNSAFELRNGIFYQHGFDGVREFTKIYLDIRQLEERIYDDESVKHLPDVPSTINSSPEWPTRKRSVQRLSKYLSRKTSAKIIEVGCGNGWLINYLSQTHHFDYCGIDINEPELIQAARIFGRIDINFAYCDILSSSNIGLKADVIILAAAIQYFPDLRALLNSLLELLNPDGEIHILDSPFYKENNIRAAEARGKDHFAKTGVEEMKKYYFYHKWKSLEGFSFDYYMIHRRLSTGYEEYLSPILLFPGSGLQISVADPYDNRNEYRDSSLASISAPAIFFFEGFRKTSP